MLQGIIKFGFIEVSDIFSYDDVLKFPNKSKRNLFAL